MCINMTFCGHVNWQYNLRESHGGLKYELVEAEIVDKMVDLKLRYGITKQIDGLKP